MASDYDRLQVFLERQTHMVLTVTLDDGTPWAVPVKIQARSGTSFEWDSKLTTEHSKALQQHPDMSLLMYEKAEHAQVGLYLKGRGELLSSTDTGFGRYRFTAKSAWINDETFVKRPISLDAFSEL
jgi:hypothetical protein